MIKNFIPEIIYAKTRDSLKSPGTTLSDAINFGFSYIEHRDHIVEYIVANKRNMKKIIGEIPDSEINPDYRTIGDLWTAKLCLSEKLSDKQILLSNSEFSVVIDIDLNQN
jgi:hypothetical protein